MAPISEARRRARRRANEKYNAKAYDRIELKVTKGKKETIKAHAETKGESLNGFINRARRWQGMEGVIMYSEGDTLMLKDGSLVMVVYVDNATPITVCDPMDPTNAYTIPISKVLSKG